MHTHPWQRPCTSVCVPPFRPTYRSWVSYNNWRDSTSLTVWSELHLQLCQRFLFCFVLQNQQTPSRQEWNKHKYRVQRVSRAFWQPAFLGDSSWTLHRANSGTGCTKTWPRSEASPLHKPWWTWISAPFTWHEEHTKSHRVSSTRTISELAFVKKINK